MEAIRVKISQHILQILELCRIEGNTLYLPPGKLDRKDYDAVNKCITNIGGKWNRKAKGHVFDSDPSEAFENMLLSGETTDMKKVFQFFPTPRDVAEYMCELAELTEHSKVLEPSVGKGGIADVVWERGVSSLLGIELNQEMGKYLNEKPYNTMIGVDFLDFAKEAKNNEGQRFTHIIMNPPFSKQREIEHIRAAFELLAPGGILVSVLSHSPFWRTDKKSQGFRDWLESEDSFEFLEEIDLPEGTFKESGTMIPTKIIKLRRNGVLNVSVK
jgi:phospholipid N-methyltransferase